MKYVKLLLYIIACFTINKNIYTGQAILTFFMQPYPHFPAYCQEITDKLQNPGKIATHCIRGALNHSSISGIFCSYAGILTLSDADGQIAFPRMQAGTSIDILITQRITPIIMTGLTIDHWELEEGSPAVFYKANRKEDTGTGQFYWEINPADLPASGIIPRYTLIIFAKPKNIYISEGITLTQESPHLILPDVYVKKGINIVSNALYVLNLKHFFGQLLPLYKKEATRYSLHWIS